MKKLIIFAMALAAAATVDAQSRFATRRGATAPAAAAPAAAAPSDARASAAPGATDDDQASDIYIPAGTELDIALKIYGQLVGKTVLKDPSTPDAKITLVSRPGQKLTKEDQIAALEAVFEMNGIHMEPYGEEGKFVRSIARDKARVEAVPVIIDEEAAIPNSSTVYSVMIPFKNIPIDEAKTVLEGLKSPKGLLLVYERIGKVLVTDTGLNINSMRKVAREIDVATPINENVFVRQIKNASATDIKTALEQIVQESQKELEKASNAAKTGHSEDSSRRLLASTPNGTLLRRPGQNNNQPAPAANLESLVTSVSDADRGMIRGKVLITADERSNKLIVITSKPNMDFFDKVIGELDVETTPEVEVKVVRLKYAEAEDVSDMINDLIGNSAASKNSSRGSQNPSSSTARSGTGGNLTRGTSNQPARPNNAAQRSGESKAGQLSKDNVDILADKRINGLVVMAHKDVMPTVLGIIESMDVRLAQVLIETVIVEVTLGDDLQTGIDWVMRGRQRTSTRVPVTDRYGRAAYYTLDDNGNVNGTSYTDDSSGLPVYKTITTVVRDGFANNGSFALGGGGGSASSVLNTIMDVGTNVVSGTIFGGANPIGSGINYFLKSDKLNLAAVIQASKSDSHAKYVASPVVMTVDNKEATIEATESRKFYSGSTTTSSGYNPTTSYSYSDKDIGIKIKVKPKINPNGTVMLNIEEEYSQLGAGQTILVSSASGNPSKENVDTALTRKMSADVLLENRESVVLGGLTETFTQESETGIPILKDIPWIGKWLFGHVSQSESRKELLVFMTPYVLTDGEMAQAEALRRKNAMSDSKPFDTHGWSDSPIADPVSQKERLRKLKEEAKKRDEDRQTKLAIEKWKMDRAKELDRMNAAERKFWLEQHKDELIKESEKDAFDERVENYTQEELKELAEVIKKNKLGKADATIKTEDAKLNAEFKGDTVAPQAPAPAVETPAEPAPEPAPVPAVEVPAAEPAPAPAVQVPVAEPAPAPAEEAPAETTASLLQQLSEG